jgi:protein CpxP
MSKLKLLTIAVIGLLVVNLAMVAFFVLNRPSQRPEGRLPMEQDGPKNIIIEKLHFDKEQSAQYESLIEQHQVIIKSLNDSIKDAKNELYSSLTNQNFTGKDSLIAKLGLLQRQIELTHYEHFAAIKKLCKPNQLDDYTALTKELSRFFAPVKKDGPPPRD